MKKLKLTHKILNLTTVLATTIAIVVSAVATHRTFADEVNCAALIQKVATKSEVAAAMLKDVESFAMEHNLPTQLMKVGPPERQMERLFVALDASNPELLKAYQQRFNLDTAGGGPVAGTLALEFQYETSKVAADGGVTGYITGVLRPSGNSAEKIYRWGKPDLVQADWWQTWLVEARAGAASPEKNRAVFGFGHVIGLTAAEKENVRYFLDHPDQRAACKSDNCVAWTSSIELGKTLKGAPDAERKFLFGELGMSRAMAHFEIGRRLVHASNERHSAIFVFVNGQAGKEAFEKDLRSYLPPNPKIPYINIIKDLKIGLDTPLAMAVRGIKDGAKVFIPIAAGASPEAVTALIQHAAGLKIGLDVHMLVNGVSEAVLNKAVAEVPQFRIHSLFLGGNLRKIYNEGKIAVIPGYLGDFTRMMRDPEQTQFHYDAIVVRVSPPNAAGQYSLGPNNDMIMTIIRNRPGIQIIAEINPKVPFTTGKNFITKNQITASFESTAELAGPAVVPLTDVEEKIGKNLAQLMENNVPMQIGIGNIFGGLPKGLAERGITGIEIFTEMFGDPMMEMIKQGSARQAMTGFAYGSDQLYNWLNLNPKVEFVETEFVNSPGKIAEMKKFHAINTALQVSLLGDVNATMGPGGRRISSPGGQVEFMSGAAKSEGGKGIIAIRSTAKEGTISTIVLDLYAGPVTTPHESVTHVVTEYGIARLAGKSETQRAVELIKVAHPKFRKELMTQAKAKFFVKDADLAGIAVE